MNEVIRQLHDRKSVRVYEDRPVAPEVKRAILEAAVQAPSAGNMALYTILDITDQELKSCFSDYIGKLAGAWEQSKGEVEQQLKKTYDGYRFHQDGVNVYNPYSLLNAFADEELGSYWFETGTPTFLVQRLKSLLQRGIILIFKG